MSEEYSLYDSQSRCKKCDSQLASTKYIESSNLLRRICQRCGYAWDERPVDRTPQAAPP